MVVAIDGPAGVGKSSLARRIAEEFHFFNLNSGSFYRAMVLKVLNEGINPEDEEQVIQAAARARLEIRNSRLFLDGHNVESRLRTAMVDRWSSILSTIVPLRHIVNDNLRRIAGTMDLVAEGRDMTTVVFPHAEVKIYLTASPEVRARRRFEQGTSGKNLEEILQSIRERDERDRNKKEGSLRVAEDASVIDTSALTLEQVCDKVNTLITGEMERMKS